MVAWYQDRLADWPSIYDNFDDDVVFLIHTELLVVKCRFILEEQPLSAAKNKELEELLWSKGEIMGL
jgi:hypothetical protein